MSSREEFMRQMGITTDDVRDPVAVVSEKPSRPLPKPKPYKAPSHDAPLYQSAPTEANSLAYDNSSSSVPPKERSFVDRDDKSSYTASRKAPAVHYNDEQENVAKSQPVKSTGASGGGGGGSSARDAFLRSLGIDNMEEPSEPSAPAPPRRNTASQEYAKPTAAAATRSYDDEESSYSSNSFAPKPQSDLTLGHRKQRNVDTTANPVMNSSISKPYASPPSNVSRSSLSSSLKKSSSSSSFVEEESSHMSADELKAEGNKHFEAGEFRKAIRMYSRAIEKDPANSALYSNRSAAYLHASKQMGIDTRTMALRDADKVIELRKTWFKGYSRRGDALFKLERFHEAAEAYEEGLNYDEGNINMMHSLGEARNAAGGVRPAHRTNSWVTAPPAGKPPVQYSKSAYELLDELRTQAERTNPDILIGNDYKSQQLESYRSQRSSSRASTYDEPPRRTSVSFQERSPEAPKSAPKLDKSQITEEFSSNAAAAYQQKILEEYRRKKAAQASR